MLTFWHGIVAGSPGHRNRPIPDPEPGGCFEIYNDHYQLLETVTAVDGWSADQHDFLITPQGDAVFTVFKLVPMNLSKYGGPSKGYVGDSGVQEIDLAAGKLVFSWDMLDHVSLAASQYPASYAKKRANHDIWDAYHMNSLDLGPNNQLLISSRNAWAVYDVDMTTGNIGHSSAAFSEPLGSGVFVAVASTVRPIGLGVTGSADRLGGADIVDFGGRVREQQGRVGELAVGVLALCRIDAS